MVELTPEGARRILDEIEAEVERTGRPLRLRIEVFREDERPNDALELVSREDLARLARTLRRESARAFADLISRKKEKQT